ncbi:MAG: membrane protein insertase YidC [Calditrichaeota bacterium]|nr:MAG: membrane protein insertase YidC [Calditrichota bacterium]
MRLELENLDRMVRGYAYFLSWRTGLRGTEPDFTDDMRNAKAYAYQGDAESFDAGKKFNPGEWDNPTKWVAIRTKYFAVAVIPKDKEGQAVRFRGEEVDIGEKAAWKKYGFDLEMPFEANRERVEDNFTIYFGPLDYDIVKAYGVGLENMMSFGWAIFRPFGKMILWSFNALYKIIPNYGWVIVIFSILIKLLLFPLTRKSYQSMKEMQRLQPLMQEINEKYKDDPQKKQQEIMNLYRAHGVNPLGGCIPMLLQWPLLIALFNVFRTTIQLRGAPFILWIHDLSRPDTIAHLPFSLPLYGDTVNVLPLFMGVTMFVQQKMTMKDPKQKAMVYFMPLFFTLLFNRFPSGLNLYYALFNLFSIIQEKVVPYHPPTEEELKERAKKATKAKPRRLKHDYRGRYYKQK